jgi:hypothetical protein
MNSGIPRPSARDLSIAAWPTAARALIVRSSSDATLGPGWQQVPDTYYHVYFFGE